VGVVGNLQAARKNISEAIDIALESQADCIHLWGDAEYSRAHHHRIKVHRWTSNKRVIYDTFDVLVNLSKQETFGMVVIEAMSAGLPCLLSSIPAFEQFRGCPGVRFIDEANREQAPQIVNELLQVKAVLKADIIAFWNSNFSEAAVADEWRMLIDEICDGYGG
jgi:glycosyltransferase involved in cell wall biosynthesis